MENMNLEKNHKISIHHKEKKNEITLLRKDAIHMLEIVDKSHNTVINK